MNRRSTTSTDDDMLPAEEAHEFGAINTIIVCFVLATVIATSYLLKKYRIYWIPESAAAMIIGMIIGLLCRIFYPDEDELHFLRFQPEMFFFVLLPPIIFEAGFTLKKKSFFRNFSTICSFAILGTIISTFVVGFLTYGFARAGVIDMDPDSPLQSLLFGALISAVDPVATLSIMGSPELKTNKLLYSLVFGESVLNDAVAIVLFKVFVNLTTRQAVALDEWQSYVLLILEFLGISVGSVVIGVVFGLSCAAMCKHTNLRRYPYKEIAILFLFAYASYGMGEAIGLSGIMALFFCGIVLSHYNWYNLSRESQVGSSHVFKAFAMITENVVFAYMGMCLFTGEFTSWDPAFIVLAIIFCLIGRALNTFPISYFANFKRKRPIPKKMQYVIWFSGLRGAIAFALSMNMPNGRDTHKGGKWNNDVVVTTTLCIVVFTTIVCGGLTERTLSCMGMKFDPESPEPQSGRRSKRGLHSWWKRVDTTYMQPLFGGPPPAAADGPMSTELSSQSAEGKSEDSGRVGLLSAAGSSDYMPPDITFDYDDGDIGAGTGEFFGVGEAARLATSRGEDEDD